MADEVARAQARLRAIEVLVKADGALGKLEIAHSADVQLGAVRGALEELIQDGLVKEEGDRYVLVKGDSDQEFTIVTELVLDLLEILGPLPPKDLSELVIEVLGSFGDIGPGKVQGIANAVAMSKKTPLRRKSVGMSAGGGGGGAGGGGAGGGGRGGGKWARDFFYLLKQTDELGPRLRMYESARMREQWRSRIMGLGEGGEGRGARTEGIGSVDLDELEANVPIGEGAEDRPEDFAKFMEHLKGLEGYEGQVAHVEHIPARGAKYGSIDVKLAPELRAALEKQGLSKLYTHQADAINALAAGKNIVVATPNASGKTLCYTIPIFDSIAKRKGAKALYITPTKALEQDQLLRFRRFYIALGWTPAADTYDGDTVDKERKRIRTHLPDIVLTNPDELHYGILPYHTGWKELFKNLDYVIMDEVHTYQGVFGSHVALVLRRLQRVCELYGSHPRFVCASATIANPAEFSKRLVGLDFEVIDKNGAPQGPKTFVMWNPPLLEGGRRRSPYTEAVALFKEHVKHGIRNITFTKARRIAELILRWTKDDLVQELGEKVSSYRAGYTPTERRAIEKGLLRGDLIGVTATNALELGIDIGDLDATILVGYPGTVASTWQQANRAGRGNEEALITMIGLHDPLDQYLMHHPDHFFKSLSEMAVIDPENAYILRNHLAAAALELPIGDDEAIFGPGARVLLEGLEKDGALEHKGKEWRCLLKRPHRYVNIRSASRDNFKIMDVTRTRDRVIGSADRYRAFTENHTGAIYIHQGVTYYVRELALKDKKVYVEPIEADYYTEPLRSTEISVEVEAKRKEYRDFMVHYGRVEVVDHLHGFVQVRESRDGAKEVLTKESLKLPPTTLNTASFWVTINENVKDVLEKEGRDFEGGLHGVEHLAAAMLPLYAICERRDLGGTSLKDHRQTGRATMFIYDNTPGGVGLTEKGYHVIENLLDTLHKVVRDCTCEAGCPSCIHSPYCGKRNEGLDKAGTIRILELLLEDVGKGVVKEEERRVGPEELERIDAGEKEGWKEELEEEGVVGKEEGREREMERGLGSRIAGPAKEDKMMDMMEKDVEEEPAKKASRGRAKAKKR